MFLVLANEPGSQNILSQFIPGGGKLDSCPGHHQLVTRNVDGIGSFLDICRFGGSCFFKYVDPGLQSGKRPSGCATQIIAGLFLIKIVYLSGQVNDLYKKKTGNDLGGASARAFTGLQTWVYILEKAGSTKPADIQKAANTIYIPGDQLVVPWAGIKFSTTGDELGQNVLGSGLIGQYQKQADGTVGLEIIYPFDVASADMIFPMPQF